MSWSRRSPLQAWAPPCRTARARCASGLLFASLALLALVAPGSADAAIPASERQVLLDLYNATNGAGWTDHTGWNGAAGTECSWYGIACDPGETHVVDIGLGSNKLTGTLPALGALTALESFAAYDNSLSGTIPPLAGLSALRGIDLGGNALSGSIPALGTLTALRLFSVYGNALSGSIPSLAGLTALEGFDAGNNNLSGSIPALSGLGALQVFAVNGNDLSGAIPALGTLGALQLFYAGDNALSGAIPPLAGLASLQDFSVENNQLGGAIPALAGLGKLQYFNVSNNALSGSIPSLAGLTALQQFNAPDNQLSGAIPALSGLAALQIFVVADNSLTGSLPSFGGLTALQLFYAYNNNLSGAIPSLDGLTSLQEFAVSGNGLSGAIPPLAGLAALQVFVVADNALSGAIPPLAGLRTLQAFYVQNNALTGGIPSLDGLDGLRSFYIYGNQLQGTVPLSVPPQLTAADSRLCPNGFAQVDNAAWDAATGVTPWWLDCATGGPLTVTGNLECKSLQTLEATESSASYEWIVDGDGAIDRSSNQSKLLVRYPTEFEGNVTVRTRTATGATTTTVRPLSTEAPRLVASAGTPLETCGNGDGLPQPGERFTVPVTMTNNGAVGLRDGFALFIAQERLDAAAAGQGIVGKMIVDPVSLGIGSLAPKASKPSAADTSPLNVTVSFSSDAVCGASYGLRFAGGVDGFSFSKGQLAPVATFTLPQGAQCQVFTGDCSSGAATAVAAKALSVPRQGLYYNPVRPGNGLANFVIPQAGAPSVFFGAWFTAGPDRNPTWYLIQGPIVGSTAVAPIIKLTRDVSAPTFTTRSTVVGQALVTQKGPEDLLLFWQIGDRAGLELMSFFVGGPAPMPNRTGAWYNPGESGWGQLVHQYVADGQINSFVGDFLYDAAGEPRWVLTQSTSEGLKSPTPHSAFQAHCPGCPWIADWGDRPLPVGNGSQNLIDATNGVTSASYVLPEPYGGVWNRNNLPLKLLTVPQ